jgi:AmmeMemoRadiSam system protein B
MAKVRLPCQAGAFYEGTAESLRKQIKNCFLHELGPRKLPDVAKNDLKHVIGLVCPHAGYMYSGPVAAHAYYELALDGKPDVAVILGPNHTGYGSPLATMSEGVWRTPLGDVGIDTDTATKIIRES